MYGVKFKKTGVNRNNIIVHTHTHTLCSSQTLRYLTDLFHLQRSVWSTMSYGCTYVCQILTLYSPVVTICTAQWSIYVPHSGQYMYRTVVTMCTAQWSLYVQHSGQYMYRTVVIICTAQRSLYVPHSGQYMYRTVVNICTAQWSLYVAYSGHYM